MEDVIGIKDEVIDGAPSLLETVMQAGHIIGPLPVLVDIRQKFRSDFENLPDRYKHLSHPDEYPVRLSPALSALQKSVK